MTTDGNTRRPAVRALVAAVTAWLTVVALGSTLVWAVISRAGEGVVSGEAPSSSSEAPTRPTEEPSLGTATSAGPTERPSRPESSASPSDGASASAPSSSAAPTSEPPSDGHSKDPEQPGHSSPPPQSTSEQRTWSGRGGSVTAQCNGSRIKNVNAIPDDGYGVQVEQNGPVELTVKFERNGQQEGETEVNGVCRNGVPQLTAEVSNGDD